MFLIDILLHTWIVSTPPWAKSKCGVISINVNIRIGDMQGEIVTEEKLLRRTNNIGPTTYPWGTPYAEVQRMQLCLQSIDFEVGRWCMGTFIVPY